MNLYVWKSKYLESYYSGDIIVMAGSVEAARELARNEFERNVRKHKLGDFDDPNELEDYLFEDYQNYKAIFKDDISKEPDIIESGALFISGSD